MTNRKETIDFPENTFTLALVNCLNDRTRKWQVKRHKGLNVFVSYSPCFTPTPTPPPPPVSQWLPCLSETLYVVTQLFVCDKSFMTKIFHLRSDVKNRRCSLLLAPRGGLALYLVLISGDLHLTFTTSWQQTLGIDTLVLTLYMYNRHWGKNFELVLHVKTLNWYFDAIEAWHLCSSLPPGIVSQERVKSLSSVDFSFLYFTVDSLRTGTLTPFRFGIFRALLLSDMWDCVPRQG